MIESVTEFMKNFRERLASPFFFSFIISWILFNWEVTVALLWYNSTLYPNQGDLISFIREHTSNTYSVFIPLSSAFLYTALIRNSINALVAFTAKWGGNWNLKISEGSKIPMSKFLTYRNLYVQTNKKLEEIISDESRKIEEYDTGSKEQ